jgi:hypothetical protein
MITSGEACENGNRRPLGYEINYNDDEQAGRVYETTFEPLSKENVVELRNYQENPQDSRQIQISLLYSSS